MLRPLRCTLQTTFKQQKVKNLPKSCFYVHVSYYVFRSVTGLKNVIYVLRAKYEGFSGNKKKNNQKIHIIWVNLKRYILRITIYNSDGFDTIELIFIFFLSIILKFINFWDALYYNLVSNYFLLCEKCNL